MRGPFGEKETRESHRPAGCHRIPALRTYAATGRRIRRCAGDSGTGSRDNGPLSHIVSLDLAFRDTAGPGHARTVGGVGLGAMTDMAQLDLAGRVAQGAGRIAEQLFLLFRGHHAEQLAGLLEVVGIIAGIVPAVRIAG